MYPVELRGKLASSLLDDEDLLTGQVFSLFYYGDRQRFLSPWLRSCGLAVTDTDAAQAQFEFWPQFADGTEPDLMIDVGAYLLVIEAKLRSDFGLDRQNDEHNQLRREIHYGRKEAEARHRTFFLLTVTAEPYPRSPRYDDIPAAERGNWIHRSWQSIADWLEQLPQPRQTAMSRDLLALLWRRNLRSFRGFGALQSAPVPTPTEPIFYVRPTPTPARKKRGVGP